jgi:hypothetical protein
VILKGVDFSATIQLNELKNGKLGEELGCILYY